MVGHLRFLWSELLRRRCDQPKIGDFLGSSSALNIAFGTMLGNEPAQMAKMSPSIYRPCRDRTAVGEKRNSCRRKK